MEYHFICDPNIQTPGKPITVAGECRFMIIWQVWQSFISTATSEWERERERELNLWEYLKREIELNLNLHLFVRAVTKPVASAEAHTHTHTHTHTYLRARTCSLIPSRFLAHSSSHILTRTHAHTHTHTHAHTHTQTKYACPYYPSQNYFGVMLWWGLIGMRAY